MTNRLLITVLLSLCVTAGTVIAQEEAVKSIVRIEVDQAVTKVLREWIADLGEQVQAVHVESPNLEFAFRVNGKIVGRWHGEATLSEGYNDDEYRNTKYDFNVAVFFQSEQNQKGETTVLAKSIIRINTRKGLGVPLDAITAELTAPKPKEKEGMLFFDSEWHNKTNAWTEQLPKRSDDALITIWKGKLENHVDHKIIETVAPPTIELVARPVR